MPAIKRSYGLGTIANHYEEHGHPLHSHVMPIYQTSSFGFKDMVEAQETFSGINKDNFVYTRGRNPNTISLAKKIAMLEGIDLLRAAPDKEPGEVVAAHCAASGMGAIAAAVFSLLKSGDHVVTHTSLYSGTHKLFTEICPRFGITVSIIDSVDIADWQKALAANPATRLVYVETPSNPRIELHDIKALAGLAHENDAWIAVDNTAATPYHQRPLTLGCDMVIHSSTKFLNGHGVALGGAVVSRHPEFVDFWGRLGQTAMEFGATPSPSDSWLTSMGLKTFAIRMERHSSNALAVAQFLQSHPKIREVFYPGLPENRFHDLAKAQMFNGFGSFMSFEVDGGKAAAHRLIEALQLPTIAISFGSTDSVIQVPASMTHSGISRQDRKNAGISDGLVRFCVGIEEIDDILDDFDHALRAV
ncbi:aminotransferase class V-fold PLP-dependent enzyme [Gammaproteobacteria bacterium]|nr:aminotransferase class V-fold PLP-dependent enzyme [Gammaproteobacteria bacterium]